MAYMTTEGCGPCPAIESLLCGDGGTGAQRKATLTWGHTADWKAAAVLGTIESKRMVQPSFSESTLPSVPCPPYVWVTLGQERTLTVTLPSSPMMSRQPGSRLPALAHAFQPWGRSQILWPLSESNLAGNFHLERKLVLPPAGLAVPVVGALWCFLCWDPVLP